MIEIERLGKVKQECSCCSESKELLKITISTGQGGMGVGIRICDKCALELGDSIALVVNTTRTRIDCLYGGISGCSLGWECNGSTCTPFKDEGLGE